MGKSSQSDLPSPAATLHRLRVQLLGVEPPVWRVLSVPSSAGLDWLHAVLQIALGWTNSHLHQFQVGTLLYTASSQTDVDFASEEDTLDEAGITVQEAAPDEGTVILYDYDFGDSWEHEITVEAILPADRALLKKARCLEGMRACPPDDCGGVDGYRDLLKALKNPIHPDHASMVEWLGRKFDPEAFDLERVNHSLGKLGWPRVTDNALCKVLMFRDSVRAG